MLVAVILISTRDADAALADFLALAGSIRGALGRRWLAIYPLVAAGVLVILLLAPDTYSAFGLLFELETSAAAGLAFFVGASASLT